MLTACLALHQVLQGTQRQVGLWGNTWSFAVEIKAAQAAHAKFSKEGLWWEELLQTCRLVLTSTLSRKDNIPATPDTAPAAWIRCLLPGYLHYQVPEENQEGNQKCIREAKIDDRNLSTKAHAFDPQKNNLRPLLQAPLPFLLDTILTSLDSRFLEGC